MIPLGRSPGSDPNERLSREYAQPRQAPRMPRNIIRNPVKVPGDGLPMETVKAATGFDRLLDAVGRIREEAGITEEAAERIEAAETELAAGKDPGIPICSACGMMIPAHEPGEPCPECHGDVYDHPVAA